jgi:hypothetical protein
MPLGPPNLAATSARFSTPVTHRRYGEPTTTDEGLQNDPEPTDTAGRAHHWPEPGRTLERAPEGYETTEIRAGTTTMDLRLEDTGRARADSLMVGDVEYTVISTAPRHVGPDGVVTFRSFVMARVEPRAWAEP